MTMSKGITLIALIVTIIVLLILAGVSIGLLTGENGILNKAKLAREENEKSSVEENNRLGSYNEYIDQFTTSRGADSNINSCSPILLITAAFATSGSSTRAAGEYKASSDSYTKINTDEFSNYFSFDSTKGWTVLKAGNYLFSSIMGVTFYSTPTDAINNLLIGNQTIVMDRSYVASSNGNGNSAGNINVFLSEGEIIDYSFKIDAATTWNSTSIKIYAMFR